MLAAVVIALVEGAYARTPLCGLPGRGRPVCDQLHLAWVANPARTLTVVWRTRNAAVPSVVEYRRSRAPRWRRTAGRPRPSGTTGTLHQVTLRRLAAATPYRYRVRGPGGSWSGVTSARTAPRNRGAFTFAFVADTGVAGRRDGLATGTRQVVRAIARRRPLLVLGGGDFVSYTTDRRYRTLDGTIDAWFNQMQSVAARAPLMPAYGNHEVHTGESYRAWAARFPTPAGFDGRRLYSFDVAGVHFVSIFAVENVEPLPASHLRWLRRDLGAARAAGVRWIIPFFHVSPFANGTNHPSNVRLRAQLGPLFQRFGVKLVLSAHDQAYERTYPLRNVPSENAPTSRSLRCYTLRDGVTWTKVSPGGKLSNQNRGFSRFRTYPAPAWSARRDNRRHVFALVRVSARALRVTTYGVRGDGSRPVVVDAFVYRRGACRTAG